MRHDTAAYTYVLPALGDIEADIEYTIDDPDGVPTVLLHGVWIGGSRQSDRHMWGSVPLDSIYLDNDRVTLAIGALVRAAADRDDGWKAGILREKGYAAIGAGGNDPDARWVRKRLPAPAASGEG